MFNCFKVMDINSRYYGSVTLGVCFVAPWIVAVVAVVFIRRLIGKEKKKEEKEKRGNTTPKLWADPGSYLCSRNDWILLSQHTLLNKTSKMEDGHFAYNKLCVHLGD